MSQLLRVGGLTPLTSIDFPGELSAVVFCQGCPWRCRYCHNGHLLEDYAEGADWENILGFLRRRRGLLDAVVFSGGEPTAQRALPEAMRVVRELGFKVGLHTGGPYPERLAALLPLVDWVGLDIKTLEWDYPLLTGVPGSGERAFESLRGVLASGVDYEVRITVHPMLLPQDKLERLLRYLQDEGVQQIMLQRCQDERMLDDSLASGVASPLPEKRCSAADWLRGTGREAG